MNKEQFRVIHQTLSDAIKGTEWEEHAYYVGGCVRDTLLERPIKDIDICINKPNGGIEFAEFITKKLGIYEAGKNPVVFPQFGTAKFRLKSALPQFGDIEIETVQTRKEAYRDAESRKPETCFGTMEEDCMRRDLTVNALYCNLKNGLVFHYCNFAEDDLKNHLLRTPSDPDIAFNDDALRILRVIRFAVTLGWGIERKTWVGMCKNAHRLTTISKERIREELNKILISENPAEGIRKLYWCGALKFIIPQFEHLKGLQQGKCHYEDAFDHSLTVLSKTSPKIENRLAGLLHDIGKYLRYDADLFGNVHFRQHEKSSAELAKTILEELKYPHTIINNVVLAVANHMRFKQSANPSNHNIRKFVNEVGEENIDLCLDVIEADNQSHAPRYCIKDQTERIKKRIAALKDKEDTLKVHLPINGKDIMKEFNLPKGSTIGAALKVLTEYSYINPKMTKAEAITIVKEALEKEII